MEFSNCSVVEEFSEVLKVDEENTIIFLLHIKLLTQLFRPFLRVIGPVAFPLSLAPWIPHLNQLHFFAISIFHLEGTDDGVSMVVD